MFERTAWPLLVAGAAARAASTGPRIDVGARIAGCGDSPSNFEVAIAIVVVALLTLIRHSDSASSD